NVVGRSLTFLVLSLTLVLFTCTLCLIATGDTNWFLLRGIPACCRIPTLAATGFESSIPPCYYIEIPISPPWLNTTTSRTPVPVEPTLNSVAGGRNLGINEL
ncbi:hypothetical protein BgiBS90_035998, partial [Biomphalaria glabrata]